MNQVRDEYRIVCHGAGFPGHHEHVFKYNDLETAKQMRGKRDDEWARNKDTEKCVPFHLEQRKISDWNKSAE